LIGQQPFVITPRDRRVVLLLLFTGVAAPLLFFPFVVAAGIATPGYGHIASTFSDSAAQGSPHPEIIESGLFVVGLCLALTGAGLARVLPARAFAAQLTLSLTAAGIVATASFQDYNRSPAVERNREGMLHNAFAMLTVVAMLAAILALLLAVRGQPGWDHFTSPAALCLIVVAVAGLAFNFGPDSHDGLAERVLATTALAFLATLSLNGMAALDGFSIRGFVVRQIDALTQRRSVLPLAGDE
jgi:hypothetical protein